MKKIKLLSMAAGLLLSALTSIGEASSPDQPEPTPIEDARYTIPGLPQHQADMDGTRYPNGKLEPIWLFGTLGYIIAPVGEVDPQRRWVWIAPYFLGLKTEIYGDTAYRYYIEALLDKGFHVAGINVGTTCGSPDGAFVSKQFYEYLIKHYELNSKARLIGHSNGGLIAYSWAFRNPEKVDRVLGILPATDIRSWPGLERAATIVPEGMSYDLSAEELDARMCEFNPIDNLKPLADAGVKILHVHGDQDDVVPLDANSQEFQRRYRALGGEMDLDIVAGANHGAPQEAFRRSERALQFLLE